MITGKKTQLVGAGVALAVLLATAQLAAAQPVYGVAAMDKDTEALRVTVPAEEERVYKLFVDCREAGAGADAFNFSLQIASSPNVAQTFNPGTVFETYGLLGLTPLLGPGETDALSVRFNTGNSQIGTVHVDNFRLFDVTEGNRMLNGGFENSTTGIPNWRFYATTGDNGQYTLISDPQHVASGNQSILVERLSVDGGSGLDMWGSLSIKAIPGEELYLYAMAKKDPAYAGEDTRLRMALQTFDETGAYSGVLATNDFDIPDTEFTQIIIGPAYLDPATVATVSAGFQVMAPGGAKAVGGYYIDDVVFARQAPAVTGNLIVEGDFENNFDGFGVSTDGSFDVSDQITIDQWRFYAVSGAGGGVTPRSSAASSGSLGIELVRLAAETGDTALVKGPFEPDIPAAPRVYKCLVDARDGSLYGTPEVRMRMFKAAAQRDRIIDPGVDFETFGFAGVSDDSGKLGVKFFIPRSSNEDRSAELDNVRVYDATYDVNRVVNGGFENSDTQLLGWRFFDVTGGTGSATVDSDAFEGANAVLLERTDPTGGDLGLDRNTGQLLIGALPGETLHLSCMAKTVSRVDAELRVSLRTFDTSLQFIETLVSEDFIPSELDYELLDLGQITLPNDPTIGYVNIAFRLPSETDDGPGLGAFLIDDVQLVGINLATNPPNLLPNGDFEVDPEGTSISGQDFPGNDTTFTGWRVFAVDGAGVSVTSTAAAASSGALGIEFIRDYGICRDMDVDGSGFIDFGDFVFLEGCYGGPGAMGGDASCTCFDQDGDEDNDLADFAEFQVSFEG